MDDEEKTITNGEKLIISQIIKNLSLAVLKDGEWGNYYKVSDHLNFEDTTVSKKKLPSNIQYEFSIIITTIIVFFISSFSMKNRKYRCFEQMYKDKTVYEYFLQIRISPCLFCLHRYSQKRNHLWFFLESNY